MMGESRIYASPDNGTLHKVFVTGGVQVIYGMNTEELAQFMQTLYDAWATTPPDRNVWAGYEMLGWEHLEDNYSRAAVLFFSKNRNNPGYCHKDWMSQVQEFKALNLNNRFMEIICDIGGM